jgi:soluble lytic murein transglycosylase-like protein
MEFMLLHIIRRVRVLCALALIAASSSCTLQTQERIQDKKDIPLPDRIALSLAQPVTRFPLKAEGKATNYAELLYGHPRTRSSILRFYSKVSGSERVAKAILDAALKQGVDVNLAFALAKAESDFNPAARSTNRDKSVDKGLFQLNSRSYPSLTDKEAYDPVINAHKGMAHFRFSLDYGGDVIRALAVYNAGLSRAEKRTVPSSTYDYIERVLTYEDEFDERFRDEVVRRWIPVAGPQG